MGVKTSITPRSGTRAVYRDGQPVGEWPSIGFGYTIHGSHTGLTGTYEAAVAYCRKETHGDPVPPDVEARSKAILRADHNRVMTRFPFTPAEKTSLRALTGLQALSEDWINPPQF